MKKEQKKTSPFQTALIILFVGGIVALMIYSEIHRRQVPINIREHRATATGQTTRVAWEGSGKGQQFLYVHYGFLYNEITYRGKLQLESKMSGNIKEDEYYLVEFDSLHPQDNKILLDSPMPALDYIIPQEGPYIRHTSLN